jgi:hypothetical protein
MLLRGIMVQRYEHIGLCFPRSPRPAGQRHRRTTFADQEGGVEAMRLQRGQHQFRESMVIAEFRDSPGTRGTGPHVVMADVESDPEGAPLTTRGVNGSASALLSRTGDAGQHNREANTQERTAHPADS